MSVLKSQRSESKLEVLCKAEELAVYTIKVCKNEKRFPKRDRWILTQKIVNETLDTLTCIKRANATYVTTAEEYTYRRGQQTEAYAHAEAMLTLVEIAYQVLGIEAEKIEYWTGLIKTVEEKIQSWKKSDKARYKNIGADGSSPESGD